SHLALDMIAHNTPLLYPFSMRMIGIAPRAVVEGGLRAYVQHPVFLLEGVLLGAVALHWWRDRAFNTSGAGSR
ncbi:MAG: hypothetical protein K8S97_04575, partial [Anaerolineae bacterium]|nr:hypothetical protein [Anaerolineae bacterium]